MNRKIGRSEGIRGIVFRSSVLPVLSLTLVVTSFIACGRGAPKTTTAGVAVPAEGGDAASEAAMDPAVAELWARAADGEADDLARLFDREGSSALVERGHDPAYRLRALRALGYASDFYALPWLAEVAAGGEDADALAALDSASQIAAEPRRATDPEDALELREGCDALLALARDPKALRPRRVGAVRTLRMLADRGCVKRADIPADVDVK